MGKKTHLRFCQHPQGMSPCRAEISPWVVCLVGLEQFLQFWFGFFHLCCSGFFHQVAIPVCYLPKDISLTLGFWSVKNPVFIRKKWMKVFKGKTKLTCSLCHPLAAAVYNRNLFLSQYLLVPRLHWKFSHLFQRHEQNPPNLQRRKIRTRGGGYWLSFPSHICTHPNVSCSNVI